ncbi:MAG: AMP-binding protein [Alphaproteobacteria bacterium]|nr:AMP-binding protein [Alphaproteobacteria bacterium]
MTDAPTTLVDLLRLQAATRGDRAALTFLRDGDASAVTWTFAELDRRARAIATALQARVPAGERVMLLHPQGLEYVAALFGCMYAGVLAVPLQPPGRHRARQALPKLEAIAADGGLTLACTIGDMVDEMTEVVAHSPGLADVPWLATDAVDDGQADAWQPPDADGATLAYLQYTSGSTSTPKGVMVSHANLLYNLATFDEAYGHDDDSVMVSWLPTFHDLGLVYGVFMPVYKGFRGVLLDPVDFLRRPLRWVEAIHRFRGTHSPSPNFAFDLVAAKATPDDVARLDLSCWKVALNGAEPIRYETEAHFVEVFGPCGVTWRTISHAYGMSEATAVIAKEPVGTDPIWLDVDGAALEAHEVVPVAADAPGARRVAGCGETCMDTTVVVADPDTLASCPAHRVGELWVGGPTRAEGYWNQPDATREGFLATTSDTGVGPFLRTGDLGFVWQGQVYVTGRLKDLIIIRGENHYPQDVEWSVQNAHPAIRPSCVAAFSIDHHGTEALGVVAEVYPERLGAPGEVDDVFAAVREAAAEHGLQARRIVFIAPRSIFKTSSGKIMRRKTAAALADGSLDVVAAWEAQAEAEGASVDAAGLPERLAALPDADRHDALVHHILSRAAAMLGFDDPSVLDADAPLRELGFDSVQAVDLAEQLGHDLGKELGATVLFEFPSAGELASHLLDVAPVPAATAPAAVAAPDGALDDLDADALAALLEAELGDL